MKINKYISKSSINRCFNYLHLLPGLKSKVRDHYHAHRLSLWQQLLPRLQMQGKHETELLLNSVRQLSTNNLMPNLTSGQQQRLLDALLDALHRNNHPRNMAAASHQLHLLQQQLSNKPAVSGLADGAIGDPRSSNLAAGSAQTRRANQTQPSLMAGVGGHGSSNPNEFAGAMVLTLLAVLVLLTANLFVFIAIFVYRQRKRKRSARYASNSAVVTTHNLDQRNVSANCNNSNGNAINGNQAGTLCVGQISSEKQQMVHSASLVGFANTPQSNAYVRNAGSAGIGPGMSGFYFATTATPGLTPGGCNSAANATSDLSGGNGSQLISMERARLNYAEFCCDDQHLCIYNDVTDANNPLGRTGSTATVEIKSDGNTCLANHGLSSVCNCGHCEPVLATVGQHHNQQQQQQQQQLLAPGCGLVGLVSPSICDSSNCNLTVIHEFDERL